MQRVYDVDIQTETSVIQDTRLSNLSVSTETLPSNSTTAVSNIGLLSEVLPSNSTTDLSNLSVMTETQSTQRTVVSDLSICIEYALANNNLYNIGVSVETEETPVVNTVPVWDLSIDFNGDGIFTQIKNRIVSVQSSRGRDYMIGSSATSFESWNVGRLIIVLDDSDGEFNPWTNTLIQPGLMGNLNTIANGSTKSVFTGILKQIRNQNRQCELTFEDGWRLLVDANVTSPVFTDMRASRAIHYILDCINWPFKRDFKFSYGNNVTVFPIRFPAKFITDEQIGEAKMPYWFVNGQSASASIKDIVDSGLSQFIIRADGSAQYRTRDYRTYPTVYLDQSEIITDITISMPWENMFNYVNAKTTQLNFNSNKDFYSSTSPISVRYGQTVTVWATMADAIIRFNSYTKTANTDSAGNGIDISNKFQIGVELVGQSIKLTIQNLSDYDGYLTSLHLIGDTVSTGSDITATASTGKANKTIQFNLKWQNDFGFLQSVANAMLNFFSKPRKFPTLHIVNNPKQFLMDIGDTVILNVPAMGIINQKFSVSKIDHTTGDTPAEITTQLKLEPFIWDADGYAKFPISFQNFILGF